MAMAGVGESVALGVADQAAGGCFALAMAKIKKKLDYIRDYNGNMNDVRNQRHDMEMLKKEIEQRVQAGERQLETIVPLVDDCLKEAEALLVDDEWSDFTDVNKIREKDQCCFGLVQMNLIYRYRISKKAVKKSEITKGQITKMKDCISRAVTLPGEPPKLGSMPTVYSKSLASRESTLKEIMGALNDKEVRVIGIYGMGGVGKTTLIKEVARQAETELSCKIVIAEVSQAPDVLKMQQRIAERIGLDLKDSKSVEERALKIHKALENQMSVARQVVVILDNIWKKLDLDKVGIPRDCKIALTTRSEDVCREMDAAKKFEVRGLDDTEAQALFLERARHPADHDDAYKFVTSELVKKCGGLPIAIAALADALRNQDLLVWQRAADQIGWAMEENVYPTLEWSYNFISSEEKKKFILLCCLFPLDSSIAVQDLMTYGLGWSLFQYKNSLGEAIAQGKSWIAELKSSSLLLEAEDEQHVKMHDVIREALLSIAGKGGNIFQLGSFPQSLMRETFKSYTVISMTHGDNHEPLNRFKFSKLEMLLLKGSRPSNEFPDHFFQGMNNLKVLVMSDMELETLPSSITQLKNLRMLHLERCRLSDISPIAKLVDLLFLSLRGSTIDELPREFENLVHLKLLDLTDCSKLKKIHADVIAGLTELEELYMMGSFENDGQGASLIDLKSLSHLAVLEMHVPSIYLLPDYLFFPHLSRFLISIGSMRANDLFSSGEDFVRTSGWKSHSQILLLEDINVSKPLKQSINCLLKETECLILVKIIGLTSVTDSLLNDGFRNLKSLYVVNCSDMEYIVSTDELNDEDAVMRLEELYAEHLLELKGIYNGPDLYNNFSHLKKLHLSYIKFVQSFWDDDDVQDDQPFFNKKTKFPTLEELFICNVRGIKELWHFPDAEEEAPTFPRLVYLKLEDLPELKSIWRTEDIIKDCDFRNLKRLSVINCESLEMLCPLSVATALEQLERLSVRCSKNMKEIIAKEIGDMKNNDMEIPIFPKLRDMALSSLPNLKYFFGGSIKLVFPSLKSIECTFLKEMVTFVNSEHPGDSDALFNDKVVMSAIKTINIREAYERQQIWGNHLDSRSFNELETINIRFAEKVTKIFSLDAIKQMQNLKELNLTQFQLAKEFFEHVEFYNDEVKKLALLPQLRNLVMDSFPRLKLIPWEELALQNLRHLKISKIDGLTSLFLASVCKRFVNLAELDVSDCPVMKEIVRGESEDTNTVQVKIVFPHLNFLRLSNLPFFQRLSSNNVILEISSIKGVDFGNFQNGDLLQKFWHVKELQLGRCEALLFNLQEGASAIPPRLRKLKLYEMDNLGWIPWMVFPFGNLRYLELFNIYKLTYVFPAIMCSEGFVLLEEIHIKGCVHTEQLLEPEYVENTNNNAAPTTVMLPRLKIMKLVSLHRLSCFSTKNYHTLEFPSLEEVEIRYCFNMETFSFGSLSTPRLCKINLNWEDEEECFDLNAVIKKRRRGETSGANTEG